MQSFDRQILQFAITMEHPRGDFSPHLTPKLPNRTIFHLALSSIMLFNRLKVVVYKPVDNSTILCITTNVSLKFDDNIELTHRRLPNDNSTSLASSEFEKTSSKSISANSRIYITTS